MMNLEVGNINYKIFRKVISKTFYLQVPSLDDQFTTGFNTFSITCNSYRNINSNRLVIKYLNEISMNYLVSYRMELHILKHCVKYLSFKIEFNQVSFMGINKILKGVFVSFEMDICLFPINNTWHIPGFSCFPGAFLAKFFSF